MSEQSVFRYGISLIALQSNTRAAHSISCVGLFVCNFSLCVFVHLRLFFVCVFMCVCVYGCMFVHAWAHV